MPELNWIGKDAVVDHHHKVPYRLLHCDRKLSAAAPGSQDPGSSAPGSQDPGSSAGSDADNLLVQGDNLQALKALLPYYAGKVKCIYIDPPYNTGNEGWAYNDNVKDPRIQKWLKETVDSDKLDRHDRWLCMMYPRLALLREFLTDDGAIFVSIDDNEVANLRVMMDEVFGGSNFIANVVWQKIFSTKNSARHLSESHDHIILYAKKADRWIPGELPRTEEQDKRYKNPDDDPRGPWTSGDCSARNFYGDGTYSITCPSGRVIQGPPKGMYWRYSQERFKKMDSENRIWWGKNGNNVPRVKRFLTDVKGGLTPDTIWLHKQVGNTQEAKKELLATVDFDDSQSVFITPKPTRLIRRILQIASDKDSIVMDSFAGSGTTGHAVMAQNREDGGSRRFILVEMDEDIAQNVTAQRLSRVIERYAEEDAARQEGASASNGGGSALNESQTGSSGGQSSLEEGETDRSTGESSLNGGGSDRSTGESGLEEGRSSQSTGISALCEGGSGQSTNRSGVNEGRSGQFTGESSVDEGISGRSEGFKFCKLGKPLFGATGNIDADVKFTDLAAHVYFTETGSPIPKRPRPRKKGDGYSPLLGVYRGRAIYLLFNGVMGDKRPTGGNVLTHDVAQCLPDHPSGSGPRVVFGEACRLGAKSLASYGITFRQVPYEVRVD